MAGCPSSHQPTRIREETLESGGPLQRKLNFRLRTFGQMYSSRIDRSFCTNELEVTNSLLFYAVCGSLVIK